MDETAQAIELAKSGAWVALAALVINVLVRVSKSDVAWFPVNVPPRLRAAGAIVLGFAAGIVAGFASGGRWPAALAGGLVAGMLSVTTHEVVVEGFRDGRDIGSPKRQTPTPMYPEVE